MVEGGEYIHHNTATSNLQRMEMFVSERRNCRRRMRLFQQVGSELALIFLILACTNNQIISGVTAFSPNPTGGTKLIKGNPTGGSAVAAGVEKQAIHSPLITSSPSSYAHWQHQLRMGTTRLFQSSQNEGDKSDDAAEWKATIAAFQMYKAAYGNLKVPQRFMVPNMKPWPKAAWGMRLGKVVGSIRGTGKYIQGDPKRRQVLDELGFIWQVRASPTEKGSATTKAGANEFVSLEQMYTALAIYSKLNDGSIIVPTSFVVPTTGPWPDSVKELPLGRQMASGALVKELKKSENERWKSKFAELGFPNSDAPAATLASMITAVAPPPASVPPTSYDDGMETQRDEDGIALTANDVRFQKVYLALQVYHAVYGDLLVPQPFVVPDTPDWPKDTWGLRLGARVNAIRSQGTFVNKNPERRQMLDDLGFAWNPPRSETNRGRRKVSESDDDSPAANKEAPPTQDDGTDEELSSLFDKTFDVKEFDLENDKSTPSWGFEGGGDLQELARQQAQLERKEEEYIPPRTLQETLGEARERAMEVGIIEGITENNRVIKGKRDKEIPWFNDDFGDDFVFDDVVEALTLYKSFYGDFSNLTINADFIVPTPIEQTGFLDEDDDDDLIGFDVDASARAARAIAEFEQQGDFDKSEDLIAAEIKRLQQQVGADEPEEEAILADTLAAAASVTQTAPVDNSKQWPEHLSGMMLGSIVKRIRIGSLEVRHLEERKAKLDALDFDWGDDKHFIDVPFEKAMCAMYAYYLVRGDMFVYEDFVMPNEDPWPEALAGFEIGKAVKRIRQLQNFMEAYHPDKVSLLRMIDFVWFPSSALPIDPNEAEMDDEMLVLSSIGHPDYSKMPELPMGFPEKIMNDGPVFETDDPKLWWRKWHNWEYVKDYWYEMGRRDNAWVLRNKGYPRMADEHEAKYGPGLFQQIETTMAPLREEKALDKVSVEEKKELLTTLNYYRQEMLGCRDIRQEDREAMILEFDETMLEIMNDKNLDLSMDEEEEGEEYEEGEEEEEEYDEEEAAGDDEDDDVEYEDDFDVEGELGLEMR
eukprot:CAMPEP_0172472340 /NCGR_PEP_ID=MMETSP1065-20121228/68285_1 /TAXON_ID=265537 /ORGANISM="Amphiprora paludosa, Strain CCMP125" /LENGTH=1042 /DNA_ID=CAMNT_0013230471 /DNA_START=191 /DNA_END=3319 /DNA_ORIENTATION=+